MKLLPLLALLPTILALGQEPVVSTSAKNASLLQLAGKGLDGQILVSADDWFGAIRAAEDLAVDIGKVVGRNLTLGNWIKKNETVLKRNAQFGGQPAPKPPVGPGGLSGAHYAPGFTGGHPPDSSGHEGSYTSNATTTVLYTYYPPTSDVNVRPPFLSLDCRC